MNRQYQYDENGKYIGFCIPGEAGIYLPMSSGYGYLHAPEGSVRVVGELSFPADWPELRPQEVVPWARPWMSLDANGQETARFWVWLEYGEMSYQGYPAGYIPL